MLDLCQWCRNMYLRMKSFFFLPMLGIYIYLKLWCVACKFIGVSHLFSLPNAMAVMTWRDLYRTLYYQELGLITKWCYQVVHKDCFSVCEPQRAKCLKIIQWLGWHNCKSQGIYRSRDRTAKAWFHLARLVKV